MEANKSKEEEPNELSFINRMPRRGPEMVPEDDRVSCARAEEYCCCTNSSITI